MEEVKCKCGHLKKFHFNRMTTIGREAGCNDFLDATVSSDSCDCDGFEARRPTSAEKEDGK
jgi:hypothetical protein